MIESTHATLQASHRIAPNLFDWRSFALLLCLGACHQAQAQNMAGFFDNPSVLAWMLYGPAACASIVMAMMLLFREGRSLLWKIVLGWGLWTGFWFLTIMATRDANGAGVLGLIFYVFSPWTGLLALIVGLIVAVRRSRRAAAIVPTKNSFQNGQG